MFYKSWVLDRTNCPEEFQPAINEYMAYADICNGSYVEFDEGYILEIIDNEQNESIQRSWQSIKDAMNKEEIEKFILLIWW